MNMCPKSELQETQTAQSQLQAELQATKERANILDSNLLAKNTEIKRLKLALQIANKKRTS